MLQAQIQTLIEELSKTRVEVETLKMENGIWKRKCEELTIQRETLSTQTATVSAKIPPAKTHVPGSIRAPSNRNKKELEKLLSDRLGEVVIAVVENPDLLKKGRMNTRKDI